MPTDFVFWNEVIIPLAVLAAMVTLGFPVVRGVVRYFERKSGAAGEGDLAALRASVEELRSRLDRAQDQRARPAGIARPPGFCRGGPAPGGLAAPCPSRARPGSHRRCPSCLTGCGSRT